MEEEIEAGGESSVEIVRVPWYPVVAVVNVGIGVVPRPVDELDGHDVVRYVNEHCDQTHGERLGVVREIQSRHSISRVI